MKLDKKLLSMKAHLFLMMGGSAPIFPFVPIILKDLGFSSMSVGCIFTVYPLLAIFFKPLFGSIADKFRCHWFLLLFLLFVHLISMFVIQWIPSLQSNTTAELICDKTLALRVCSDKLTGSNPEYSIAKSLNSSTTICQVETQGWNKLMESKSIFENDEVTIKLGPRYKLMGNCLVTEMSGNLSSNSTDFTLHCIGNTTVLSNIHCEDEAIMELITKPSVTEDEEMGTYPFWVAFAIVVTLRIVASAIQSFNDAFCFLLLGDKPEKYGMQRMWGSVGWGLFGFINGLLVDKLSRGQTKKNFLPSYYVVLVILGMDLLVVLTIKGKFNKKSGNIMCDIKRLFKDLRICIFMFWCFICGIYCAVIWNFLFWFLEDLIASDPNFDKAWTKTLEGITLTVGCYFGEIPFFFFSGWILSKIGNPKSMVLVLFVYGLRFLLYSYLTNPWWIIPIEVLSGITFGLFYATMVTYTSSIAPSGTEVTVQNIVGSVFEGAGTSIGSLLGGYLFKKIGSAQTLFILGISALSFSFIYFLLQNILVGKKTEAKDTVAKFDHDYYGEELKKLNLSS